MAGAGCIAVLPPTRTAASNLIRTSICRVSSSKEYYSYIAPSHRRLRFAPPCIPFTRLLCSCSLPQNDANDMAKYKEIFSKRMAVAGLKPYHRIGIRCEIAQCEWSNGRPKKGHLLEAARDMSGMLGLAGMASSSELFSTCPSPHGEASNGILLVRPLLDFSKHDLYKICQGGNQTWVEDPTSKSPIFARNRIRMSLGNLSTCVGFVTSITFIFLVGVFMSSWLGASVLGLGEWFIKHMPFVRHIYNASKQISAAISPDQNTQTFKEVAIIRHPRIGEYAFGFITSSVILQNYSGDEELCSIYVPTNHLYIGDIFLVNAKDVIRPNLSVREGIEIVVSGGMSMPQILSTLDSRSSVKVDRSRNDRS